MNDPNNKKLLILYSKNSRELINRKSAIGSYAYCLSNLFHKSGHQILLNSEMFTSYGDNKENDLTTRTKNRSPIKKIVPNIVVQIYRDIQLFVSQLKLYRKLKRINYFDIIIEFYVYGSNVGYKLAKRKGIPLITIYDGPVIEEYEFFNGKLPVFNKLIDKRQRISLKMSRDIIVYSKSMKNYLIKEYNLDNNIRIHQNIDFSRFTFYNRYPKNSDMINIGFIGSFLKWHRVDLLIDSFKRLKDEKCNIKLYLVGEGQESFRIQEMVDQCEYKDDIIITGFLDGEDLRKIKEKIDIGVMPGSNWYGAPVKIFEYGAAQMASIAPDTPTIIDLFSNEEDIILFKHNSSEDLYLKLKHLLDNHELIMKLGVNLQEKIRAGYTEEKTLEFYKNLIH